MSDDWSEETQAAARTRHEAEWQEMVMKVRRPEDRAASIEMDLEALWLGVAPGKTSDDFERAVHEPFDFDRVDLDALEEEYDQCLDATGRSLAVWPHVEKPIIIAYGWAYNANLAAAAGEPILAWSHLEKASFWLGYVLCLVSFGDDPDKQKTASDVAKKAAHARNAENRAIKAAAMEWLTAHRHEFRSKEKAAEGLIRIEPIAFRTALRYVNEFDSSSP